jgi:uncharacterized protein
MGGNLALLLAGQLGAKSLSRQAQGGRVEWPAKSLSHGKNGPARRDVGRAGAIEAQGGRVEWASFQGRLKGVMAVCPDIDPDACVTALEQHSNRIYHDYFVNSMKSRIRRKAKLFPDRFDVSRLAAIRTLRGLDDAFTAPDGGYQSAQDYYERTGARHVLAEIEVPALIVAAKDDPFIPYRMFETPALQHNSNITLMAVESGGHCGFFQCRQPGEDRYWAENRLIEFIVKPIQS